VFIETSLENDSSYLSIYGMLKGDYIIHKEFSGKVSSEIMLQDDEIYFVTIEGNVYKYKTDGSLIWKYVAKQFVHSNPALSGNTIVFGTDNGSVIGLDAVTGRQKYISLISGAAFEGGITIKNNIAYLCGNDGVFYALELNTGNVIFKTDIKSRSTAFPVVTDNIYLVTLKGEVLCLSLNGTVKWRKNTGGLLNAAPLFAGGKLIIPDMNKKVLFVDSAEGKTIKEITLESKTRLTPAIYKNMLIIGYERGVLEGYEFIR
jgi:outer membrane protein assembly factor BamB